MKYGKQSLWVCYLNQLNLCNETDFKVAEMGLREWLSYMKAEEKDSTEIFQGLILEMDVSGLFYL